MSKNYLVHDTKTGKVFGTLAEAAAYAEEYRKKTRVILCITETTRKVSHVFKA